MKKTIIPHALPHEAGVDAEVLLDFYQKISVPDIGLNSFILMRHGKIVAETYFAPYSAEKMHIMYSLSKSVTSTAVGFAVQEGLLKVDDLVWKFFADELDYEPSPRIKKMTVRHLLTMSAGHQSQEVLRSDNHNWVHTFLATEPEMDPGAPFFYHSLDTYMCSAIVTKLTGMSIDEYLKPRLFDPLGIDQYWWEKCPNGVCVGGWGLNITTEEILRLGKFWLQRGMWEGKQLLDSAWIDEATAWSVSTEHREPEVNPWSVGYGYQFWRTELENAYRADGAFGQFCIVMPDQDTVVAITASSIQHQRILDTVRNVLVPGLYDGALEKPEALAEVREMEKNFTIRKPMGGATAPADAAGEYFVADNPMKITKLGFDFENREIIVVIHGDTVKVPFGYGEWVGTDLGFHKDSVPFGDLPFPQFSCAAAWDHNVFEIEVVYDRTPYGQNFRLSFANGGFTGLVRVNNHPANEYVVLNGRKLK